VIVPILHLIVCRSELEAKNAELLESVASLKVSNDSVRSQLQESKESLAQVSD